MGGGRKKSWFRVDLGNGGGGSGGGNSWRGKETPGMKSRGGVRVITKEEPGGRSYRKRYVTSNVKKGGTQGEGGKKGGGGGKGGKKWTDTTENRWR